MRWNLASASIRLRSPSTPPFSFVFESYRVFESKPFVHGTTSEPHPELLNAHCAPRKFEHAFCTALNRPCAAHSQRLHPRSARGHVHQINRIDSCACQSCEYSSRDSNSPRPLQRSPSKAAQPHIRFASNLCNHLFNSQNCNRLHTVSSRNVSNKLITRRTTV
jgi:hypothetical protein